MSVVSLKTLTFNYDFIKKHQPETCCRLRLILVYETDTTLGIACDHNLNDEQQQFLEDYFKHKTLHISLISQADMNQFWFETNLLPNIRFLDTLLQWAIELKASDLHIHQEPSFGQITCRIQGQLISLTQCHNSLLKQLYSQIKLDAHMDISTSTLPQDGRLTVKASPVDVRVSSIPTAHGEDMVLRFLSRTDDLKTLAQLGFSVETQTVIENILQHKSGLVLVTGPTGSGKTTTVYALLRQWLTQHKGNVVTLEDPIESLLPGVRQSPMNEAIGYTYAQALKTVLRQDPDVIMIGEIRDAQTAKVALEAAYTGHLVISTLHTHDCSSSLLRLGGFNLDPFWVGYCLRGILSQKLLKKLCKTCKKPHEKGFEPQGCSACNQGYSGQTLVSQTVHVTHPKTPLHWGNVELFLKAQQQIPWNISSKQKNGEIAWFDS